MLFWMRRWDYLVLEYLIMEVWIVHILSSGGGMVVNGWCIYFVVLVLVAPPFASALTVILILRLVPD